MNRIGCGRGIGGALCHTLQGENFCRHIGSDKLILDFKEGRGTKVRDKSPYGNDGTLGAGAAKPTWKKNGLYFNGDDYIALAPNFLSNADFVNGGSFEVIFKGTSGRFFDIEGAWFFAFSNGNLKCDIDGSYLAPSTTSLLTYNDNVSHHSIVIWDKVTSATVELFVNGKRDGSSTQDTYDIDLLNRISSIGSNWIHTGNFLIGTIKTIRIIAKRLSRLEIQQKYLAGKFSNN